MSQRMPRFAKRVFALAENDPQLRALMPDPTLADALQHPALSYQRLIETVLNRYADRAALGEREADLPAFRTVSYAALHGRIRGLASAWARRGTHTVHPGEFVCILGFAGIDYVTVDLACAYAHAVGVPLQGSLAGANFAAILTDTAPACVAATMDDLALAVRLAGAHGCVRSIIAMDCDPRRDNYRLEAARAALDANGSQAALIPLAELIAAGDAAGWAPAPHAADSERMALLLHSSGSTGTPKGAIIPERAAKAVWSPNPAGIPVVKVCFAPLNHLAGRSTVYATLARGGTVMFTAKPDLSKLFEDIRLARPTELVFFPRALEMIHRHFLSETLRRKAGGEGEDAAIRAQIMLEMRAGFLGDRLSFMNCGAAPTTPEVRQFINECFDISIADGYGSTEMGAVIVVRDRILRPPVIDYRLRDVPELGYYRTDTPFPRGELCVKTQISSPGYYKRPEATAALFDADGYTLSGDIVEERGPDHIVYIDRRNDVLKLSQGEFVAIGALGTAFENGSDVIHQMYAYGNSARSHVLAVIVPNQEVAESLLGVAPDDAALKSLIRAELKKVAAAEGLRTFEVPRDFIVERQAFTHENGLLSSVHKRLRPALQARYGERLEQLYAELEARQEQELRALRDAGSGLSVLAKVGKALEAALGIENIDAAQPYSFGQLGGDSLGATAFAALLEEIFGVGLPVNTILSPAGNAVAWARAIEAALRHDQGGMPGFDQVHGKDARELHAADLDVGVFIDAETLERAALDPPSGPSTRVLLTGATGFLGRFLCLEWLERLQAAGGKLTCLVRAADQPAALRRLSSVFEGGDPALARAFHAFAETHLEVVVGDVAEPRLGLDEATFGRLAREIDHIVHPAALVNHVLSYADLFGPNVAGTAELVRLALTHRRKRFDFVSSVAVIPLLDRGAGTDETAKLRETVALTDHYGAGYGTSKWAAEQLLHSAHRRFALPVNIFRGDMMLAHRRYHGQINAPDVFTRLLASVIMTGLAPASFYRRAPDGGRPHAHYDGLPVDFIAGTIAGIGAEAHRDIRSFHVINHHADDGMSLDVFVDWIEQAGYGVERVAEYRAWFSRFEAKLRALPDEKRARSSLQVLRALAEPHKAGGPMPGSRLFQAAVRRVAADPGVPHLGRAFILKCLADMRRLGLVPAPAHVTVDA